MFQVFKESFRSNLWEAMGKLDHNIPIDYEYPIVAEVYSNIPALACPNCALDLPTRAHVVISEITYMEKLGGNPTYMRSQAWNLVIKMVNRGDQDLARALDLELEGLDVLL